MSKVIIATGASGLVGSRVIELLQQKYQFINYSLETNIDITDFNNLRKRFYKEAKKIDSVIHLAAFTDVDKAWEQNGDKNGLCYQINVIASKNIAQLCQETDKYLIHISTDFIFDGKNPPQSGYTEENKPNPIEWYGKTKCLAEKEIKHSGCQYSILRIAYPFKAKNSPLVLEPRPRLDFIRKIIAKLKNSEELHLFFDQLITPTFIDDIALAIDRVLQIKPRGIFHCTGSTFISPYNLAAKVAMVFAFDLSLIKKASLITYLKNNPQKRPYPLRSILSNKKTEKKLGIKFKTIDEALAVMKKQLNN